MNVGIIILAHGALQRGAEVADFLLGQGVPVAMHIDRATPVSADLAARLDRLPGLIQIPRRRSPWGSWALVDAALRGAQMLLQRHPDIGHVALISGSCLPIRPISELSAYLDAHPGRDFIQSVKAGAASWVTSGLQEERFTYWFPFDFRRQRRLFDVATRWQRRYAPEGLRQVPTGIEPCLGSQWWCLSRATLEAILTDPMLPDYVRYFRGVWIPDEAFFQTLARKHSWAIESRSMTWARFDRSGLPVMFYDDHIPALSRPEEGHFFARKIWSGADRVYGHFLSEDLAKIRGSGARMRRIATRAREKIALLTPAIPRRDAAPGKDRYLVIYGAEALFPRLSRVFHDQLGDAWIGPVFTGGDGVVTAGGLSRSAAIARANPSAYLANLLRGRDDRPALVLPPTAPPEAAEAIARDPLARVVAVKGAWCIPMHVSPANREAEFAATQKAEAQLMGPFQREDCRARVDLWPLHLALENPLVVLKALRLRPTALRVANTAKLEAFLSQMRDAGVSPTMAVPNADEFWDTEDESATG